MATSEYMRLALDEARTALGTTSPNPAVGAVVVAGGQVAGQGRTQPPGGDHAEIGALHEAGERARGATLYVTLERIRLPDDLVARLEGKSSLGRLGLLIHSTAGFIDPGWDGHVTLELSNVANLPITIYYAMKIGQLSFVQMTEPAETPYGSEALGSKYQGQRGPTPSRYWKNFQ